TLVALTPRPTFQLETAKGPVFAEAGPAPGEGAHAQGAGQSTPLAYLEGKDAAALTRSSALLAQMRALAQLPAGTGGTAANASISPAGKLLGDVIAAAQKAGGTASAAVARTPL